jgi:type I restriction enzyme S subunit
LLNHWREKGVFVKLSRRAVNQANYNRNEIYQLDIPFPEYNEQREIADVINSVESKMLLYEQEKGLLEELFRTLLHQLMTGQIRVNDINLPESLAEMNQN